MSKLELPATFSSPQDLDKATQSNYTEIKVKHTHLEWTIDWSKHIFHGHASLNLIATGDVKKVVLDTSYLDIKKVEVEGDELKWTMGDIVGTIGSALSFDLPKALKKDEVSGSDRLPTLLWTQCQRYPEEYAHFSPSTSESPTPLLKSAPPSAGSTPSRPRAANILTSILSPKL